MRPRVSSLGTASYFAPPQEQPAPHMHAALQAQSLPQMQGSAFVQPHVFLSQRHSFRVVIGFSLFAAGPLARRHTRKRRSRGGITPAEGLGDVRGLCNMHKSETSSCDFAG